MQLVHLGSVAVGAVMLEELALAPSRLDISRYVAGVWFGKAPLPELVKQSSLLDWLDCSFSGGALPSLPQLSACAGFVQAHLAIAPDSRVLIVDDGNNASFLALACLAAHETGSTDPMDRLRALAIGWTPNQTEHRLLAGYAALIRRTGFVLTGHAAPASSVRDTDAYVGRASGRRNSDALKPGAVLGNYTLLDTLGQGAGGSVWRARDRRDGGIVALKGFSVAHEQHSRLDREAEVARLVQSPHVVRVFAVEAVPRQDAVNAILVMEYIEGKNLHDLFAERERLPLAFAVTLVLQVCEGLSAIHGAGIIHRDIKPANVILASDGSACIVDFGAAERLAGTAVAGRIGDDPYGTPVYMAPEQWAGYAVAQSDLYAVGVMLYQALSGAPPFSGRTADDLRYSHIYLPPPSLAASVAGLPPDLVDLVSRLLAKRPSDRPASAHEVAQRLAAIAARAGEPPAHRA